MKDLEVKLLKEMKPESRVVACRFPLPNLKLIDTIGEGIDSVWTYEPVRRSDGKVNAEYIKEDEIHNVVDNRTDVLLEKKP